MSRMEWAKGRGQVMAGGKSLDYACYGPAPGDAPTIVMLHEGLGCVALWRDLPQAIATATGCGVFVYSRAGYGASEVAELPRPLDYMTREATDVLPDVLSALNPGQVILLGHSDGATIAAIYAGSVVDHRIRGLILIAPHVFAEPEGLAEIARAKVAFDKRNLRQRLARYHRHPDVAFNGWCDAWLAPEFANWNVAEVIDYLRIPTLVIQGADDPYGTIAQVNEIELRSYAPVDVLILPECGHAPHIEQQAPVLAEVTDFTSRLWRIEGVDVRPA